LLTWSQQQRWQQQLWQKRTPALTRSNWQQWQMQQQRMMMMTTMRRSLS
jgi:hypothetical protein